MTDVLPNAAELTPPVPATPTSEVDEQYRTMAPGVGDRGKQQGGALIVDANNTSNIIPCGECGKECATFECLDCGGEWYCRPCAILVHSKGRRKNHAQFKEHPICDICRSRLATLLCEKCDEVYCSTKCAYGAHDGSPRTGSKKRLHQWESLPNEGLAVKRPPHLEHAVDTRGGRNSFGISLAELNLCRFEHATGDNDEDDDLNFGDDVDSNGNPLGRGHSGDRNGLDGLGGGGDARDVMAMREDLSRLSGNQTPQGGAGHRSVTPGGNEQQQQGGKLTQTESGTLVMMSEKDKANNNNQLVIAASPSTGKFYPGGGKDNGMNAEEKIFAGKATEAHFSSDSPTTNAKRARMEIKAAVAARNLPPPDLDEVVTLVTSAANVIGDNQQVAARGDNFSPQQHQGKGIMITNSVRGAKAAQLLTEAGLTLAPTTDPIPERLLMAGMTDKLEAASKKRNELLARKLMEGAKRAAALNSKIHGWRRWDFIRSEPAFFGQHETPLIVYRPLPPLLPMIADLASDNDHEFTDTGFASYVPFFERTCHDDPFLLAVASILASNGCQHVKTVRLEDGGDMENGVFTPRIRGGPVINVVAPGFEGPEQDNRQQKKKALEKADAAMPCPIGNIFLTIFASCERLHDLGLATFRFFKPTTGEELQLGTQRHLVSHKSPHKATNGVVPPIVDAVEHFVTVDTLFPVFEDGRPAFGRTDIPDEFWLALLEKAYATMHGQEGYSSLIGGSPVDPLFALCGGEPTQLQWNLQQLDSSAFATGGGENNNTKNADIVSPLAMRARVVGISWWMLQVATQYNLPICVTKRHDHKSTQEEDDKVTWYRLESGLDEVEKFDWKGGDVVFFAVNHTIDRNLIDAQQFMDDEDDRSSNKSGMTSSFNASFSRSQVTAGTTFGVGGGGHAVQTGKEEHRLLKLRQLYNTSRNNDRLSSGAGAGSRLNASGEPVLPLWHDGSNKWSDIASRVSGSAGVANFAARRAQQQMSSAAKSSSGIPQGSASAAAPAGASIHNYAESVLSRKETNYAGGASAGSSMWTKPTRKALQHHVADERLTWMDVETFTQKYNTILIAQNMPQHKHHTFFGTIDMRISENVIAKTLPHYLVVVEKRELENSDEIDDRKWAEGIDSQFKSIADIMKPPRSMKDDLGIGLAQETDDAAEEGGNNANDDTTSVASSQVSIAESLADMGTMGSRRSLVLRITITQPTTKLDPNLVQNHQQQTTGASAGAAMSASSNAILMNANPEHAGKGAASIMLEETQEMIDALTSFKSVMQPEELTLYAFRVSQPVRQDVTSTLGPKGDLVYSLPIHTKCPVNSIDDPIAIGPIPAGLHQITFEMEANPGSYNLVVAPTRGMGRTDLSNSSVAQAHFSMHICSVRNGENFEVKAGKI